MADPICVYEKECLIGEVGGGRVRQTSYGDVADACWHAIPDHFRHVTLDRWVTMPNHIHGIPTVRAEPAATSNKHRQLLLPISIGVRSFKSAATKQINELRSSPGAPVWQRSFHEHVLRDTVDLARVRRDVSEDPAQWTHDNHEHAHAAPRSKLAA